MKKKVVNLKDFVKKDFVKKDYKDKDQEQTLPESKGINKVVITFTDGTTKELDKGMLLTLVENGEDSYVGTAMINLTNDEVMDVVHGFSQFAIGLMKEGFNHE